MDRSSTTRRNLTLAFVALIGASSIRAEDDVGAAAVDVPPPEPTGEEVEPDAIEEETNPGAHGTEQPAESETPDVEPSRASDPPVIVDVVDEGKGASAIERAPPALTFLGFEHAPEHAREARLVEDLTQRILLDDQRIQLASADHIADALRRAEEDQRAGCSDVSATCARAIALVLGARYVVTGSVTSIDGSIVADLILLDTREGLPKSRERIVARRLDEFSARLRQTLTNLLAPMTGDARVTVDDERAVRSFDDADVLSGAFVLGAGVSALLVLPSIGIGALILAGLAFPAASLPWGLPMVVVGLVLPFLAGAAGFATALAIDLVAGAPIEWLRVLATTTASAAMMFVAYPIVIFSTVNILTTTMTALDFARDPNDDEFRFDESYIAPTLSVVALSSLSLGAAAGALAGSLSLVVFAFTESSPEFGEE